MKINPQKFYAILYALLKDVTPLFVDCGEKCGGRCCEDSDEGTGMYLYPLESCMYQNKPSWAKIEKSGFYYGDKEALLLSCPGRCERTLRPLACRIFPLVPYKKAGEKMKVIFDPRAAGMCPLSPLELTDEFVEAVEKAMRFLVKTKEGREFIEAQSVLIDEYVRLHL